MFKLPVVVLAVYGSCGIRVVSHTFRHMTFVAVSYPSPFRVMMQEIAEAPKAFPAYIDQPPPIIGHVINLWLTLQVGNLWLTLALDMSRLCLEPQIARQLLHRIELPRARATDQLFGSRFLRGM